MSVVRFVANSNPWYGIAFLVAIAITGSVVWRSYVADAPLTPMPAIEQTQ